MQSGEIITIGLYFEIFMLTDAIIAFPDFVLKILFGLIEKRLADKVLRSEFIFKNWAKFFRFSEKALTVSALRHTVRLKTSMHIPK